jgi:hypothetical protein
MTDADGPSEVPLDTLVGALDIIGRLKGIERAIQVLSDEVANLHIMFTAAEIARTLAQPLPALPSTTGVVPTWQPYTIC